MLAVLSARAEGPDSNTTTVPHLPAPTSILLGAQAVPSRQRVALPETGAPGTAPGLDPCTPAGRSPVVRAGSARGTRSGCSCNNSLASGWVGTNQVLLSLATSMGPHAQPRYRDPQYNHHAPWRAKAVPIPPSRNREAAGKPHPLSRQYSQPCESVLLEVRQSLCVGDDFLWQRGWLHALEHGCVFLRGTNEEAEAV